MVLLEVIFNFTVGERKDNGKRDTHNIMLMWRGRKIKCTTFNKSCYFIFILWIIICVYKVCVYVLMCTRIICVDLGSVKRSRCFLRGCMEHSSVWKSCAYCNWCIEASASWGILCSLLSCIPTFFPVDR